VAINGLGRIGRTAFKILMDEPDLDLVCPEHIHITDSAIIPIMERMAGRYFDPVRWLARLGRQGGVKPKDGHVRDRT